MPAFGFGCHVEQLLGLESNIPVDLLEGARQPSGVITTPAGESNGMDHYKELSMPRITLTDLIEVVTKSGSPKATKVSQLKNRQAYDPATDFYKALREGLVALHKKGGAKSDLASLAKGLADPKKAANYPPMITGYRRWWGTKVVEWFPPPTETYTSSGIDVAVNPEIGLRINGQAHVIKLYLKTDALTKTKADLIVTLMHHVLGPSQSAETQFSVLDVRNSKLFTFSAMGKNFKPMVDAELSYVASLWPHV